MDDYMAKVRNLKFTKKGVAIIIASFMAATSASLYALFKNRDEEKTPNSNIYLVDDSSSEISDDVEVKNYREENGWGIASTDTDKYGKIRKLEEITGISPMTLDRIIQKYSGYTGYSYEEAIKVLEEHLSNILYDYKTREEGIISVLFDQAVLDNKLSMNCSDDMIEKRYEEFSDPFNDPAQYNQMLAQQKEQEKIMIDICDDLKMDNIEKTISLSIFRLETGHGSSSLCINKNNYGGNRIPGQLEFCSFSTPEFGMFYTLSHMKNYYYNSLRDQGYNDCYHMIENMSKQYCETSEEWALAVNSIVNEVNNEYHFLDENTKVMN